MLHSVVKKWHMPCSVFSTKSHSSLFSFLHFRSFFSCNHLGLFFFYHKESERERETISQQQHTHKKTQIHNTSLILCSIQRLKALCLGVQVFCQLQGKAWSSLPFCSLRLHGGHPHTDLPTLVPIHHGVCRRCGDSWPWLSGPRPLWNPSRLRTGRSGWHRLHLGRPCALSSRRWWSLGRLLVWLEANKDKAISELAFVVSFTFI